jgi:hypothetical protein
VGVFLSSDTLKFVDIHCYWAHLMKFSDTFTPLGNLFAAADNRELRNKTSSYTTD